MIRHLQSPPSYPKRVVVLGASGFIGHHLVRYLAELDMETISISSARIDLCKETSVDSLISTVKKHDALVFASCLTREKGEDPLTMMKNLSMGQHVATFLELSGCAHVVYISSDAVYADMANPVREDSECNPSGLYGMAHLVRERMITYSTQKANIPAVLLRLCAVYGCGDTHNGYGPNRFLRTGIQEGQITLSGKGEEKRDHIYVMDVCRLIGLCLSHRSVGVLNLATGRALSFAEVAETVMRVTGRDVQMHSVPRKVPLIHRHFDATPIFKSFPSFSFTPFEKGLEITARVSGLSVHVSSSR